MFRFVLWLTVRRLRSSWRLLLAAEAGVLLAVVLVGVATLHSGTIAQAGLVHTLAATSLDSFPGTQLAVERRPMGRSDYDQLDGQVTTAVSDHLDWLLRDVHRLGNTGPMQYVGSAERAALGRTDGIAYLFFQEGLEERATPVAGRWPERLPTEEPLRLEAAVGAQAAEELGWEVGRELILLPLSGLPSETVLLEVVGLLEAIDEEDPYWFGESPRLALEEVGFSSVILPIYLNKDDYLDGVGGRYPMLLSTFSWYVLLDASGLDPVLAEEARQDLEALETELAQSYPRSYSISPLEGLMERFQRELTLARIPLLLFTSMAVGVVLYYLVMLSWLLAGSGGSEGAHLRSRGATRRQVATLWGLGEGLLVALPAAVGGPFIALALANALPVGASAVRAQPTGTFILAVGLAAGACMAVFVVSGIFVAQRGIVQFLREGVRPRGRPVILRYALDALVVALAGLVWWQIQGRGGFVTEEIGDGALEVDSALVIGPIVVIFAIGFALVRVLPPLLRLGARLAAWLPGVWLGYGVARMARDPLPFSALATLLMLSTAIGVFGARIGPTLAHGQGDRARFAVGGDIVVTPVGQGSVSPEQQRQLFAAVAGVEDVARVRRGTLVAAGSTRTRATASVLAVDPAAFGQAAWFRSDFADRSLAELLAPLDAKVAPGASPMQPGIELPSDAERVGVWARPARPLRSFSLWARLRDSRGLYEGVRLGTLAHTDWELLEAPLPERAHLTPPFELVGLYLTGPLAVDSANGALDLDGLTAVVGGAAHVVASFEERGQWEVLPSASVTQDQLRIEPGAAVEGRHGIRFSWAEPIGGAPRGLFVPPSPLPLPAVGGGLMPGQVVTGTLRGQPVAFRVESRARLVPTVDSERGAFLVVDFDTLERHLAMLPSQSPVAAPEFWVAVEEGADRARVVADVAAVAGLSTVRDGEARARAAEEDPLGGGAWAGLAALVVASLSAVALLGFVLYAALAFVRTRVEVSVLRAVGFTRSQAALVLGVEGATVAAIGIGVGVAVASWLGSWLLDYLALTVGGRTQLPPLLLTSDAALTAVAAVGSVAAPVLATLLVLVLTGRLRVAETLRVQE